MGKFILKTKSGEFINVTFQEDKEDAIEFFSSLKQLDSKELLSIYKVDKDENRYND